MISFKNYFTFFMPCFIPLILNAQWTDDPTKNTVVCVDTFQCDDPVVVADGNGGFYSAWSRRSKDYTVDIVAQKVNTTGKAKWTKKCKVICDADFAQLTPIIASDGTGGVVMAWNDGRNFSKKEVYFQRIDNLGASKWPTNGSSFIANSYFKSVTHIFPDGSGGYYVFYTQNSSSTYTDFYAQHLSSNGSKLWTSTGVPICTASDYQKNFQVTPDGTGGFIIAWLDDRTYSTTKSDVYTQKVNSQGVVKWKTDGVVVCKDAANQEEVSICNDGVGGAIISWVGSSSIYSQRITNSGSLLWGASGKLVSAKTKGSNKLKMISDGGNGAFFVWSQQSNLWANKVDSSGGLIWSDSGIAICDTIGRQEYGDLILSAPGVPIVTWRDDRKGDFDIYAQILNGSGSRKLQKQGKAISTNSGIQWAPEIITDGSGGAIIFWGDNRSLTYWDLYSQKIDKDGNFVVPPSPEIDITGKSISIANGTSLASTTNGTDFGTVTLPATSFSTFAISNSGNDTLVIDNIATSSGNSSDFVVQSMSFPQKIVKGQTLNFKVTFTPKNVGTKVSQLLIENNDGDEFTYTFALKGNALAKSGVQAIPLITQLKFFPNPSNTITKVVWPEIPGKMTFICIGSSGQKVNIPVNIQDKDILFDLESLSSGLYTIQLKNNDIIYYGKISVIK